MPPKILRRPEKSQSWQGRDKKFIEIIKQYGYLEDYVIKFSKKCYEDWQEISARVKMPANYCRKKWMTIKHNYFMLKNMIHIGIVTEEMVLAHSKTSKYLDGRLDFLDPYIFEIPYVRLSSSAHRFFDSAFGANTSTPSVVGAEKLIKVKENSFLEVIKDYKRESEKEPTSILPNIENEDSDSDNQTPFDLGMNKGLKQEEEQEVDKCDPLFLFHDVANDTFHDNVQTNATDISQSHLEDIKSSKNKNKTSVNCPLARFLVKYSRVEDDEIFSLKQYMDDLAEVLCSRLIPEKRKDFLCQVDLIVSELLEGT